MTPPPLQLLLAADDRNGLLAQVTKYRVMTPSARVSALSRIGPVPTGTERLAIVSSPERIDASLALAAERLPSLAQPRFVARARGLTFTRAAQPGRIAFLFPGQGSEYTGMLSSLRDRFPTVNGWLADLDRAAEAAGEQPLSPMIDPVPGGRASEPSERAARNHPTAQSPRGGDPDGAGQEAPASERVGESAGAKPHGMSFERSAQLGTVADLVLYEIVTALGVRADAYVGHSNGEHPAIIAAGRVPWDRAALCRWFIDVGRAGSRQEPPPRRERLLAVSGVREATLRDVLARAPGRLFHAMDNSPTQQVVGGDADAADEAAAALIGAGGIVAPLGFTRAYHTPLFADWAASLASCYDHLPLAAPGRAPVYSCLRAAPLPEEPHACRREMAAQWTALVRFRAAVDRLYDEGFRTFVEVGPDAKLTAFVDDCLRGRPHVVVSASSVPRGEFEQLFHLTAELFAAGVAIDPRPLVPPRAPEPIVVTPGAPPTPIEMQKQLIADARASLARGEAAWAAAHPRRAIGTCAASDPLLGDIVSVSASALRARRVFTRRADPWVDDHAFGRRPLAAGAFPLPVLAFTVALELAAEAARRLAGRPVRELHDVRASRWLALDAGELAIETEARWNGEDIQVRVRDLRAAGHAAAFEALASVHRGGAAVEVAVDKGAQTPRLWDTAAFYRRYAFHGPGFQGLSRVTAVGPSGIEAELRVTANAGLAADALAIDPAMVDCAGQLVAFWLLDQDGLDPSFGTFPYALRRIAIHHAPLAAGLPARCRGHIVRRGATTDASFLFETAEGAPIASLEGLMQRTMPLPRWLAALIFAGAPLADSGAAIDPPADLDVLNASFGIWARAVAHLCLPPADLDAWLGLPADARAGRLLARLSAARQP